jgi:uncharacterized membrane protein YgcG
MRKVILVCTALLLCLSQRIQAQTFNITQYNIDVAIQENGSLKIRETIDVFFTEKKHGIYKDIPTRYTIEFPADGDRAKYRYLTGDVLKMPVRNIAVPGHPYALQFDENQLRIRIGDADKTVIGARQYVIEYEVDNIMAFYKDHAQLRWNLIGEYWDANIEKAGFTIHLPKPSPAKNGIKVQAFSGVYGSTDSDATMHWENPTTITGTMNNSMGPREALTVKLDFPLDYIRYEPADASMLAENMFIKNYKTTITVHKAGTTDVAVQADIQFLNRVPELWVQLEHSASGESFGLSGRWLPGDLYYPVKNVRWSGGEQDKSNPFKIRLNNIESGDERTLTLNYTLEGNIVEDGKHPGFKKVLFSHKNLFHEPIDHAVTEIRLPEMEEAATYEINTNKDFDTRQLSQRIEGNSLFIETTGPIVEPDLLFQPAFSMPAGAIADTGFGTAFQRGWMNNQWLLYPLLILGFFIWWWFKKGKDRTVPIYPQYYPPEQMTPAEAGILIDDKLHERDVIALIPYWAARGLIRIEEMEVKKLLGLLKDTDYNFIQLKPLPEGSAEYEKELFTGLFGSSGSLESVMLSSLENTFYTTMNSVKSLLKDKVKNNKQYEGWGINAGIGFKVLGVICLIGAVMIGLVSFEDFNDPGFFSIETACSGVVLGIGLLVIGQYMPRKTLLGMEAYQQLAGYRMFMQTVEQPRLEQLIKEDPHYFDKSLPYAMVFDIADNWSEKFEALNVPPPEWYGSRSGQFTSRQFMRQFSHATKDIGNTFTSTPSKSGSSSGGSFSGGGFGGGGGGSW